MLIPHPQTLVSSLPALLLRCGLAAVCIPGTGGRCDLQTEAGSPRAPSCSWPLRPPQAAPEPPRCTRSNRSPTASCHWQNRNLPDEKRGRERLNQGSQEKGRGKQRERASEWGRRREGRVNVYRVFRSAAQRSMRQLECMPGKCVGACRRAARFSACWRRTTIPEVTADAALRPRPLPWNTYLNWAWSRSPAGRQRKGRG